MKTLHINVNFIVAYVFGAAENFSTECCRKSPKMYPVVNGVLKNKERLWRTWSNVFIRRING